MDFDQFHETLRTLYDQMMPLCSNMIGAAKGIAGLGALFYVAYRVWQSLSRAEPVDVYPLLRPFAIGLCIMFFPSIVLGTINSVMSPVVQGTHGMLQSETFDMNEYARQKDQLEYEIMRKDPETAYLVDNEVWDAKLDELGITDVGTKVRLYIEKGLYKTKKWIWEASGNCWKLFSRLRHWLSM